MLRRGSRRLRRRRQARARPQGIARWCVYAGLIGLTWLGFAHVPAGFVPAQDKQYLVVVRPAARRRLARPHRGRDPRGWRDIALAEPGVAHAVAFPGLSINGFTNSSERRHRVRHARRRSTSAREPGAVGRRDRRRRCSGKFAAHPGRLHRRLPAAAGARARHDRRLQAADRGPRRPAAIEALYRPTQKLHRPRPARRRRWPACSPASRSTCRSSTPTSTATRPSARRAADAMSSRPCRSTSARCTSTTSTASAAPTRSTPRPTRRSAHDAERHPAACKTRNAHGRDGAARLVRHGAASVPARTASCATTATRPPTSTAAPRPAISSGQAQAAIEQLAAETCRNGMSFEWTELDLPADPRRQHRGLRLPALRAAASSWCWPRSTRAGRCRWR